MTEVAKIIAFILLIIGTAGLLVNEFLTDLGGAATIIFACLNVVGLAVLGYTSLARGRQ